MFEMKPREIIISLKDVYIDGLLTGTKCVELRRRTPNLLPGTKIWLYAKVPVGKILALAVLDNIIEDNPSNIWRDYCHCSGISESEFNKYFHGLSKGAALVFNKIAALIDPIPLDHLKKVEPRFHPPQFYREVRSGPLLSLLENAKTKPFSAPCFH